MSIITASELTFNGQEVRSLNEAVWEMVFSKPDLGLFHNVVTGIEAKQQIALLGLLGLVGKKSEGCDPTSDTNNIPLSEKFWDPETVDVRLEQCWEDLKQSFFVYGQKKGVARADLNGTDFINFVEDRLGDALYEAFLRIHWFGDVDADTVDASPAGLLTSGTNKSFFNIIDGAWKQIFAIVASDATKRVTITENSNGSYTLQDTLASTRAYDTFKGLIEGADYRLRGASGKVIVCTQSLFDNWLSYKESQSLDMSFVRQDKEFSQDVYRGIPIYAFDFWDRYIRAYFDNGTTYDRPHRALLFTPDNNQAGVEESGSFAEMDVHYDKVTKKNYIDSMWKQDAKIVEDYLIMSAY